MIESALVELGTLLIEHPDIFVAVKDALTGGVSKEELKQAIRSVQVAASDEIMRSKLGMAP